tara:strand:- start:933 stop:3173 length:2241 start_codon:yes stop_codon:yes gene_type:complete
MANSSTVSTGDVAQASQYNNLRLDVLNTTSGHTHAGTTDTGIKINSNNLQGTTLASTVVSSSLTSVGTLTSLALSGNITLADSDKIVLGTGSDFEIYHDANNSIIHDNGTGNLLIGTNGAEVRITSGVGSEFLARFIKDDGVYLYDDDSALRFNTSTTGATITGTTLEVASATNDAILALNSDTDEGQDSEILFQSGGTTRGKIEYDHNTTAYDQSMYFYVRDNATTALRLKDQRAYFIKDIELNSAGIAQDSMIVWDGNEQNWYVGLDDSNNTFTIGEGTTVGNNARYRIFDSEDYYYGHYMQHSFTSDGSSTRAVGLAVGMRITGHADDSSFLAHMAVGEDIGNADVQVHGDVTNVATLHLSEPDITVHSGTVTNASTLYIANGPNEGTNDYAIFVDSAHLNRFDGGMQIGGDVTLDGNGKWVYLKGGGVGTDSTGIAWTFNTADTRYSEIQMDYDTRASVGLLIHAAYPITLDATTQINYDISGTTQMTLSATTLDLNNNLLDNVGNASSSWTDGHLIVLDTSSWAEVGAKSTQTVGLNQLQANWYSYNNSQFIGAVKMLTDYAASDRGRLVFRIGDGSNGNTDLMEVGKEGFYKRARNADRDVIHEMVIEAYAAGSTTWVNLGLAIPSTVTDVWTRGIVEIKVMGHTSSVGNGATIQTWYYDLNDSNDPEETVGNIETTNSGSAPEARCVISSGNCYAQIRPNQGAGFGAFYGMAVVKFYLPRGAGSAGDSFTWNTNNSMIN